MGNCKKQDLLALWKVFLSAEQHYLTCRTFTSNDAGQELRRSSGSPTAPDTHSSPCCLQGVGSAA